ncbi:MAG: CDP-alcohol phosphatidyltransferase family protein [Planctomycetes bacterium]|nr:CDP-alcohol phosphatidyltransferase family protein [Planctomycetota bacterium]
MSRYIAAYGSAYTVSAARILGVHSGSVVPRDRIPETRVAAPALDADRIGRWMRLQALLWLPILGLAAFVDLRVLLVVPAVLTVGEATLWHVLGAGRYAADYVTGGRTIVALLATSFAFASGRLELALWSLLVFAAIADLVDGFVARRFGSSSGGAVLDMEADQASFVLYASLATYFGIAPKVMLVLPALRYGYVLLMSLRGLPIHDPKPLDGDNRRARLVCAIVVVLQLSILAPFMDPGVRSPMAWIALALLLPSYLSDVVALSRRAR